MPEEPGQWAAASGDSQQANLQHGVQVNVFTGTKPSSTLDDGELPPVLVQLARVMRQVPDDPRYAMRERSLSGVYVRQSVGASADDARRRWEEELDDRGPIEEYRRVSRLSQPFDEVFQLHDHLVLDGVAGLGKTTLGNHLVRTHAKRLLALDKPSGPDLYVPLMLPARELAAKLRAASWPEALRATVMYLYGPSLDAEVPAELFTRTVRDIRWLIVVDALDEIPEEDDRTRLLGALASRMTDVGPARYIVTTRPLARDEVSRLKSARVGVYELQPFDEEALELFAHQWFGATGEPDGDRAAAEFLDQVRAAGLADVLTVPLLARVAAEVFASQRDRRLPASRFELYEQYISTYASGRAETLNQLRAAPDGGDLFAWLDDHRTDLLEKLATAYTTREAALVDVAKEMLCEPHGGLDPLPPDWRGLLSDWLTQTGVIGRSGRRLRFLHQTFAEHLAASATARGLPRAFVPDQPPWPDTIRKLLLGDDQQELVLLHYLHQSDADPGLLDWLQHGTQAQRERAAKLITQGAHYTDVQLTEHLSFAEGKAFAGESEELESLAALTGQALVRERLEKLADHPHARPEIKIAAIDLLGNRAPLTRREAAPFLTGCARPGRPADLQRRAAEVLAKIDDQHRALAAAVLNELARQDMNAAESLAKLGERYRDDAGRALIALTNKLKGGFPLMRVAAALARLGGAYLHQAAETYRSVADDPTVTGMQRCDAAQELARIGGEHRRHAVDALQRLADDAACDTDDRLRALSRMAWIEPERRESIMRRLHEATVDPAIDFYSRMRAAEWLAELSAEYRPHRAKLLASVMDATYADEIDRMLAVRELVEIGPEWHARAAEIFHAATSAGVSQNPISTRVTAMELAKLGGEYQEQAAHALAQLCRDPSLTAEERGNAAQELANLGPRHHQQVVRMFEEVIGDPRTRPVDTIAAGYILAALDPDGRTPIAALIYRIGSAATSDAGIRYLAGTTLIEWGPEWITRGLELLVDVFEDQTRRGEIRLAPASIAAAFDATRAKAEQALLEITADTTEKGETRCSALGRYIETRDMPADEQARALRTLAYDLSLKPDSRIQMARLLADHGPGFRDEALSAADLALADYSADRLAVADSLAEWPELRHRAARMLRSIAADRSCPEFTRQRAAEKLSDTGDDRSAADQALSALATDPAVSPSTRALSLAARERITASHDERAETALLHAAAAPFIDPWERKELGEALAMRGPRARETAARILTETLAEHANLLRRYLASTIAGFGTEYWEHALTVLRSIVTDTTYSDEHRCDAAVALAVWQWDLTEGVTALAAIATDMHATPTGRLHAADELSTLGAGAHARAVQALGGMAVSGAVAPWNRLRAAWKLTTMGPAARGTAAQALCSLREDSTDLFVRAIAASMLATIEDRYYADAVLELMDLASDTNADVWQRQLAALELADLSRHDAHRAAGLLTRLATDSGITVWERRQAAEWLATYFPRDRGRAVDLLIEMLDIEDTDAWARAEVAQAIGALAPERRDLACDTLRAIAADTAVTVPERRYAAEALLSLDGPAAITAAELLIRIAADSAADPYERRKAAVRLTGLGPDNHERARTILDELAEHPSAPPLEKAHARVDLAKIDYQHREAAYTALVQLATDTSAQAFERVVAADILADLDGPARPSAVETLTALATDLLPVTADYALAQIALAKLDATHRDPAVSATRRLLDDVCPHDDRRRLATAYAELGSPYDHEAALELRAIITDRTTDPATRLRAARDLAGVLNTDGRVLNLRLFEIS